MAMNSRKSEGQDQDNTSIIQALPQLAVHPLLKSLPPSTFLPVELLDILNHTYFLHLLVTDPSKVVPPGKSTLSMMSKPSAQAADAPAWQAQVEQTIHRAFWDAAYEALSSPEAGMQLSRLKVLYKDLHEALKPLLPPQHRVLLTLSSPFEPTSAPLLSTIVHLREVLLALKQRCAPVRDAYIDSLIERLSDPPSHLQTPELSRLIIDTVRDVLKLTEAMRDDLSQFVLGTMSEAELRETISSEARTREHSLILDLWKTPAVIASSILAWCDELLDPYSEIAVPPGRQWVARLMQALAASTPVACPLPTKPTPTADGSDAEPPPALPVVLPPPFFFSTPTLEYIQNFLQALVIVAALRALLPGDVEPGFTSRIWTLLESSIGSPYPSADDTTIAHLLDELLRARDPVMIDCDEELRFRLAVNRTLRFNDPVFVLLQRRLMTALAARLAEAPPLPRTDLPAAMRTGRHWPGVSAGVMAHLREEDAALEWEGFTVKGFEDSVIKERVREAGMRLRKEVQWLTEVWGSELKNDLSE